MRTLASFDVSAVVSSVMAYSRRGTWHLPVPRLDAGKGLETRLALTGLLLSNSAFILSAIVLHWWVPSNS